MTLAVVGLALVQTQALVYLDANRQLSLANTETGTLSADVRARSVSAHGKRLVLTSKLDDMKIIADDMDATLYDRPVKDKSGKAVVAVKSMKLAGEVVASWHDVKVKDVESLSTVTSASIDYHVASGEGIIDVPRAFEMRSTSRGPAQIEVKGHDDKSVAVDGTATSKITVTGASARFAVDAEKIGPDDAPNLRTGRVEGPVKIHYERREFVKDVLVATKIGDFTAPKASFDFTKSEPELILEGGVVMDATGFSFLAHSEANSIIILFTKSLELSRVGFNRRP